MDSQNKPSLKNLDFTQKLVAGTLALSLLNFLILLSFLPTVNRIGNVVRQVETTMEQFSDWGL